jgi:hypothetical protein
MMEKNKKNLIFFIKISFLVYTLHCLNEYRLRVLQDIENKLALIHSSLEKSKELLINKFEKTEIKLIESATKLEENLSKTKIVLKKIKMSQMESFKTSERVSDLILKMVESNQKATMIQPPITIINESTTKPIVIGILIILSISIVFTWWFAPKIVLATTSQVAKLNLIASELLKYIPGSNSAKGSTFIMDLCIKIETEIINGKSSHTVIETLTQKTYTLEEYIDKVLVKSSSLVGETATIITETGQDVSGLFF